MKLKKENKLLSKEETSIILKALENEYKDARCGLDYNTPLELTIALILAAQCTDKRVNEIRPIFFEKYKTIENIATADIKDVEDIIHSCGFYKNKAKNIVTTANIIINKYNSKVPDTMKDLISLCGIGRKSANIILQECFNKTEGIAVDTHVTRISKRLGLTNNTEPINIEKDLMKKLPKYYWNKINHILVNHGRKVCDAKKPKCDICLVNHICRYNKTRI